MRLASNAEVIAANSENFQMNAQNAMETKDQQLVQMQTQVAEYAGNMRQKDELIENLKQRLKNEKNRLSQVQTLTSMDMDQLRMTSKDTEMRLKNEIIAQRNKTNLLEHECIGERMTADQLRRDKDMILDNEANIKAIMENIRRRILNSRKSTTSFVYGSRRHCKVGETIHRLHQTRRSSKICAGNSVVYSMKYVERKPCSSTRAAPLIRAPLRRLSRS